MHFVYIIYSKKLNKFYIGETHDIDFRLERHNNNYYDNKWTKTGAPWVLFFEIECASKACALKIEKHIKRMKSKKYIQNLKAYPEISFKLKQKYASDC